MSDTMVGKGQTILKLHWLKCPKTVPKSSNLGQKINDWKPHFGVYLLISDSPIESLRATKNYQKRSSILQYSFAQKTSLAL